MTAFANPTALQKMEAPQVLPKSNTEVFSRIPATDNATGLPSKDRKDLKAVSKWLREENWDKAMAFRTRVQRSWIGVRSIMEGYHYFDVNAFGIWSPIPKREGEVRAVTSLMISKYRREHGRLVDNSINVQAVPRSARSGMSFYKADRSEIILNSWLDEINMPLIWDEFCQHHLVYGMSALRRYVDHAEKQVMIEPVPGPELAPVPFYQTSDLKLHGLQRAKMVNREWVEENVPEAKDKIGRSRVGLAEKSMYITSDVGMWNTYEDSALAIWTWMKKSPSLPRGLYCLMIEDEIFRFEQNEGIIPFEISRYIKQPSRWYGLGLCELLIAPQKEKNRQYTEIIKTARFNKGRLFIDDETFSTHDLGNSDQQIIPISDAAYVGQKVPYYYLPPTNVGRDVGVVMELAEQDARAAAGHESDIIMGQQEGRTESGPATERLNTNASAPLVAATRRMSSALKRTFPPCLDMISQVWPEDKIISTVGREDLPNEMMLGKDMRPTSADVIIKPGPIMPMGRSEMVNLLYAMKNMKGDSGGPELSSAEFRKALRMASMIPDGLESVDEEEQRIQQLLTELYNDGKTPGIDINDRNFFNIQRYENHKKAIDLIRKRILAPAFREPRLTSPPMQHEFLALLQMHEAFERGDPDATDAMGLDTENIDALASAQFLDIQEQDMFSNEGMMTIDGLPMGV